ncbi:TetR family transcriptional regulator [Dactylosporangium sp. CS-033363]|uniref:TetR family transcriptional regulator n=1 Tax=Dactylosporangium sp. CS-033363 TaxID=3239935 RepID=UPI003D903C8E
MLDAETIMVATEDVLRRYGPAKATVVDVARALGVSHAAVYRHFPSKAALREAVARRWLARGFGALTAAADDSLPPPERLRAWLVALFTEKRRAAVEDPELFATYKALVEEHSAAAAEHVEALLALLTGIIAGFEVPDPAATARTVFEATSSFHHPAHAGEWRRPDRDSLLDDVCTLLLAALTRPV